MTVRPAQRPSKVYTLLFIASLGILLAACAPLSEVAPPANVPVPPPSLPVDPSAAAAKPSQQARLSIDTQRSLIAITVRRAGPLARLGHDHVIASRHIDGYVDRAQGIAELTFPLNALTVDEAELRSAAGMVTQPSADAIDGTRHNMLVRVLEAERYPQVAVRARRGAAGEGLQVELSLHGVTRTLNIPALIEERDGALTVSGTVALKQSDFGIVPFSVMGGAIAVQDLMELRFSIVTQGR
ncbi:YceI family protein [Oxalobacteraceae bacterium]|nr:YceI family protein [Oxalobacteraceae bacterium]